MRWLRRFVRRAHAEADLDAEIRFHLDEEVRLRVERGEPPASARSAARRLFGNVAMVLETTREVWVWAGLVSAWRSLSLILRSFTQAWGFAIAAILTVALGIGANTMAFSMFDRVLFRPLPYSEPDRLVQLQSRVSRATTLDGAATLNLPITHALAREKDLFTGIAWAPGWETPVTPVSGENPLLWLTPVTYGTLDVLGVRPVIGPGFSAVGTADDAELPVLLTYETWQRRYRGSGSVLSLAWTAPGVGTANARWRVVGVLPEGFLLPSSRLVRVQYDGIYGIDPRLDRQAPASEITVAPFARLAPGVSVAAARARVNAIAASVHPRRTAVSVVPLQTGLSVAVRPYVWLAMAGAWAVLGATCLTLAILLLTWSHSRRQDAGVRLALGASPRRLVITALLESTFLCGAGAVVGWLGYVWTRSLFVNAVPLGLQPFAADTVDIRVVAATCGAALVGAVVAGTMPALRTSRTAPLDVMRPSQGFALLERLEGGPVLLAAQVAFGVILLVGAWATVPGVLGFLLRSPGFDSADLFVVSVPTASDADAANAREQTRRGFTVIDVVRGLPGVVGVALSRTDPFARPEDDRFSRRLAPPGFEGRVLAVGAQFFRTLATPIIAGRAFSVADVEQQALVAMVNESGARALWPDVPVPTVIGRTVTTHDGPRVVVGVAADIRIELGARADPALFLPLSADDVYRPGPNNSGTWNSFQVLVRMAHGRVPDRALLRERLRDQPWMIPNWGVPMLESVTAQFEPALERPRLLAAVFGTLGGIILMLTTIAVYGLASFEIRRRRDEMTVRLALGATPWALRRGLAAVMVKPVLAGVLVGLPFSWVVVKLLSLSVPLVNPNDFRIYAAAAAAMIVAALVAAWLPGRHLVTMGVGEVLRSS
jgi:predicted permease